MAVKWIVTTLLYVQMIFCLLHNSDDGVTIQYNANFGNVCWSLDGRFAIFFGLSIGQCVQECGLRKHCKALNFQGPSNVCALFSTHGGANVYQGECSHILSEDIIVIKTPCTNCTYGKVCDTITRQCIYKECVSLEPLNHGMILGNMRSVGSQIRFKCEDGYRLRSGTSSAKCTASGIWTAAAECTKDCEQPAGIKHGSVFAPVTTHGATAIYTCDVEYQVTAGDDVRTCTDSVWIGTTPVCSPILSDCEQPAGITHGSVFAPVTTHGATAIYTCDVEYQVTAGDAVRTCSDGVWVGIIPVCSPIPNVGCYYAGQSHLYEGTRRTTLTGRNCQRWDTQTPHSHTRTNPDTFPSGDVSASENFCRDPDKGGKPWCYTTDPNVRWEDCVIPLC